MKEQENFSSVSFSRNKYDKAGAGALKESRFLFLRTGLFQLGCGNPYLGSGVGVSCILLANTV